MDCGDPAPLVVANAFHVAWRGSRSFGAESALHELVRLAAGAGCDLLTVNNQRFPASCLLGEHLYPDGDDLCYLYFFNYAMPTMSPAQVALAFL